MTELGVSEIFLVKTQNSNADYEDAESLSSLLRVCVESAEQCERLSVPKLVGTVDFQQIPSYWESLLHVIDSKRTEGINTNKADSDLKMAIKMRRLLVCRERFAGGNPLLQTLLSVIEPPPRPLLTQIPDASSLEHLNSWPSELVGSRTPVQIFVGPEGGFTAQELQTMSDMSTTFHFVTLGDR